MQREACLATLRERARTDYLHALLLDGTARDAFVALRAFHAEVASVPARVNDAMVGEIRLQWWADVVSGLREGEGRSAPVGDALLSYLEGRPAAKAALGAKIEAHAADLYSDAPADRNEFEGHAGATRSVLIQLVAQEAERPEAVTAAAGHAGVAELAAAVLLDLPALRARGRVPLPADLLGECDVTPAGWAEADAATLDRTVVAFAAYGLEHVERARAALPKARGAFRALRVHEAVLKRAAARPASTMAGRLAPSPLREQWLLWRGA